MTEQQLRDLFFRTGLPEAYVLARAAGRREKAEKQKKDRKDAGGGP